MKPVLFIGSSTESWTIANACEANLEDVADVKLWNKSVFAPSKYALESLLDCTTDFALLVCAADDLTQLRDESCFTPRDNVVFELGIFMERLARERTSILIPNDQQINLHLPTDILGLTSLEAPFSHPNRKKAVQDACQEIRSRIEQLGFLTPRPITDNVEDYINYLGVSGATECVLVAHCDKPRKRPEWISAPGYTLTRHIDSIVVQAQRSWMHRVKKVKRNARPDWGALADSGTLFVLDSPHYNPYAKDLIDSYWKYLIGGETSHIIEPNANGSVSQKITVGATPYESDKYRGAEATETRPAFGHFRDYLLVMRMPRAVAGGNRFGYRKDQAVWLVYGITAKGSHAGAHLFRKDNFAKFEAYLRTKKDTPLPPYFEAVFRIPADKERVEDFDDFHCEHFAVLCVKRDPAPAPPHIDRYFLSPKGEEALRHVPISSVHFDPVAGCNLNCERCSEARLRSKDLCLTTQRICGILTDLHELGCRDLRFYGGEPTLHPDFRFIVRMAAAMGFNMLVVTNGSLLNKPEIRQSLTIAKRNLRVRVSVDGNSQDTYSRNHGDDAGEVDFEEVKRSIVDLVRSGVAVTISYLLTDRRTVSQLPAACKYWFDEKVWSFEPRHLTTTDGKWLSPGGGNATEDLSRRHLRSILNAYGSWIGVPKWFREWIQSGFQASTHKKSDTCCSAFYRFGISPYSSRAPEELPEIQSGCGKTLRATDEAWISLCLYHRYEEPFGCEYPPDLADWCKEGRIKKVNSIKPKEMCAGTVCSRSEANERLSGR